MLMLSCIDIVFYRPPIRIPYIMIVEEQLSEKEIRVFTVFRQNGIPELCTFFHFHTIRMLYGISKNSSELNGILCRGISYSSA
jgi:hypothetical protein